MKPALLRMIQSRVIIVRSALQCIFVNLRRNRD
jgi:hypothetical protein